MSLTGMKTARGCRRSASGPTGGWLQHVLVLFFILGLCGLPYTSAAFGASEGCSRFCQATGFAGVVGNCACGLSLFSAKKRSVYPSRLSDSFGWQQGGANVGQLERTLSALSQQEYENLSADQRPPQLDAFLGGPRIPLIRNRM